MTNNIGMRTVMGRY